MTQMAQMTRAIDRVLIRRAAPGDRPALGRLGALLMRVHYGLDPQRFMKPGEEAEEGYAWFLGDELAEDDVVVFVAERDGVVMGYVYAGIEPQSWKELRERAGFIHDIVVDAPGRRTGIATALLDAAIGWLRDQGVPRVLLWTSTGNAGAQALFTRLGFRKTMIEMTRELEPPV
jgi:ribosomal protein S18 acetylase RimI-like enzyme